MVHGVTKSGTRLSDQTQHSIRVQNEHPQNVSLLREDYLELKAIETLLVQEKLLPSRSYLEEFILGIFPREELLAEIDFI